MLNKKIISNNQADHLISNGFFTEDEIENLRVLGIATKKPPGPELKPFSRLKTNIRLSCRYGSLGGQMHKAMKEAGASREEIRKIYKKRSKKLAKEITAESLKELFDLQDGLDYWSGNVIDPESIYTQARTNKKTGEVECEKYYGIDSGAMSTDRIDNNVGYEYLNPGFNFVITTRGFNKMRGPMEHDKFLLWMDEQGLPINSERIPLLNQLKKFMSA
jgi:hypothetical protein|tara:strand:+ start:1046 stop:1699 length:654 start_codon:yes stop_codon:yes gene_type:complete